MCNWSSRRKKKIGNKYILRNNGQKFHQFGERHKFSSERSVNLKNDKWKENHTYAHHSHSARKSKLRRRRKGSLKTTKTMTHYI